MYVEKYNHVIHYLGPSVLQETRMSTYMENNL